jgi:hypothetical protein
VLAHQRPGQGGEGEGRVDTASAELDERVAADHRQDASKGDGDEEQVHVHVVVGEPRRALVAERNRD